MKPSQTANNYNKIAAHWASNKFNRRNGIAQHQRAIQFVSKPSNAIDVGCGSSGRFIDLLQSNGFKVEGLDFSSEMLMLAQERHPNIEFHHADICEWKFLKKYSFISAWDSVWHVPLVSQQAVLEKLCNALETGGVLIYTSGAVDEAGDTTNPFLGQDLYTAALGIPNILRIIDKCNCVCRHLENDEPPPDLHLFVIIQKK